MRRGAGAPLDFVPIMAEPTDEVVERAGVPLIEVQLAGAVLRIAPGTDGKVLTTVLRTIRASAA